MRRSTARASTPRVRGGQREGRQRRGAAQSQAAGLPARLLPPSQSHAAPAVAALCRRRPHLHCRQAQGRQAHRLRGLRGGAGEGAAAGCWAGREGTWVQAQSLSLAAAVHPWSPAALSLPFPSSRRSVTATHHRAQVAAKKKASVAEVAASIVATGGPKSSGTIAEACRFFDDKSSWCGGAGGVAGRGDGALGDGSSGSGKASIANATHPWPAAQPRSRPSPAPAGPAPPRRAAPPTTTARRTCPACATARPPTRAASARAAATLPSEGAAPERIGAPPRTACTKAWSDA